MTVQLTVVLLMAGLLAGCGLKETPVGVATYDTHGINDGDMALLEGTVRMNAECVWVQNGDALAVPIFPEDEVERREDDLVYGDRTFRSGDDITIGGGEQPNSDGASVPVGCPEGTYFNVTPLS